MKVHYLWSCKNTPSHVFFSLGFFAFCNFNLTLYYCFIVTVRSYIAMQVRACYNARIQCTWATSALNLVGQASKPLTAVCHHCQAHFVCANIKCYLWAELFKDRPHYKDQAPAPKWCPCSRAELHQLGYRSVGVLGCVARVGGWSKWL